MECTPTGSFTTPALGFDVTKPSCTLWRLASTPTCLVIYAAVRTRQSMYIQRPEVLSLGFNLSLGMYGSPNLQSLLSYS